MQKVRVKVPGTSANLGPGYDCLGVALKLANTVTVTRGGKAGGETAHPMAVATGGRFFAESDQDSFPFDWSIRGQVPQSRGMGSSVTVRLGLLMGLNALCGEPLDAEAIFKLCSELEGHPDNAAPAQFGGFTVAEASGRFLRFEVSPDLKFVLLIPNFEIRTADARKALPRTLKHKDAVCGMVRACAITAAFASQRYEMLKGMFDDTFHQPFRTPLIPFLPEVIRAGEAAGALGGFLSGSGSTIACVTLENPKRVLAAMKKAAPAGCRALVIEADNAGATVLS